MRRLPGSASAFSRAESELLAKINQGVPAYLQARYDELIAKRRDTTLTETEYDELLRLTYRVEGLDAQRVEAATVLSFLDRAEAPT